MGWSELIGSSFGDEQHHYVIEEEIARGGMSRVFRAREEAANRVVALKVMALGSEGGGDSRTFTKRFEHEARAVERLDHPNIVRVFATGQTDDFVFIAMQLVLGGTFRSRLGKPMSVADACYAMIQMAKALHHAHSHHVIHRDVKPANMLIDDRDPSHLLLADFGIAKIIGQEGVTKTGTAVGTPEYMAPEQAKGEKIDPRADIYGLACVLYEALAGRPPFVGPTALSICYQHVHTRPAYIRGFNPEVPRALALVIEQALAKNPRDRFPTAEDFANALYPFTEGTGRGIRPTTPQVNVNSADEDAELVTPSEGGTNPAEALMMPTTPPPLESAANSSAVNPDASAMLDLSMLSTHSAPAVSLPEDATMVQTQEMTPISQPSRPRHTRPSGANVRLKSRPITHPRDGGSYTPPGSYPPPSQQGSNPPPFDPYDDTRMPTVQTPITPLGTIKPPSDKLPKYTSTASQPSRQRLFIVVAAALVVVLVALLVLSRFHTATAPGTSSSLANGTTPVATTAPTTHPTTAPTAQATPQPGITPTQPVIGGQPTQPPPANLSQILATSVTGGPSVTCDSTLDRSTFTVGTTVYVNACITAGGGTATIDASLYYQNGNRLSNSTKTDQGGKTIYYPLDLGTPPVGKYNLIVTYNGYVVRSETVTIQSK